MRTPGIACLAGLLTVVAGDRLPGAFHKLAARQGYGYGYQFPPFPTPTSSTIGPSASVLSTAPSGTAPGTISAAGTISTAYGTISALSTGVSGTGTNPGNFTNITASYSPSSTIASGTAVGTISQVGTTITPYGNSTTSVIGTAYSSGSLIHTSKDPNATSTSASGKPSPSSNATTAGSISGYPTISTNATSVGSISATPVTTANITDLGYPYPTHGPYPLPSTKRSYISSGTVGTGISQSATISANATSAAPTDPSATRVNPTHGPYPFSSSFRPYSYSASSVVGTAGTSGSQAPSASPSISANATTVPPMSGTAPPYSFSLSGSPSISANATSILSSGSAPLSTGVTSSSIPSANGTSSSTYPTGGTGTGTGTGYPSSITAGPTTLATSAKFLYTPTITSQASEYYYHHRRPPHGKHNGAPSYEGDGSDSELDARDNFAFE